MLISLRVSILCRGIGKWQTMVGLDMKKEKRFNSRICLWKLLWSSLFSVVFLRAAYSCWRPDFSLLGRVSPVWVCITLPSVLCTQLLSRQWGEVVCVCVYVVFLRDGSIHICLYISCGDGLNEIHVIRIGPRTLFLWKSSDLTSVVSSQGAGLDSGLKPRFLMFTTRLPRLISITIINNWELSWKRSKWDAQRSNGLSKWCIGLGDLEWIGCGCDLLVFFSYGHFMTNHEVNSPCVLDMHPLHKLLGIPNL